jgi:hypothetical protein
MADRAELLLVLQWMSSAERGAGFLPSWVSDLGCLVVAPDGSALPEFRLLSPPLHADVTSMSIGSVIRPVSGVGKI